MRPSAARWGLFARGLLVQSSWNFQRMQNLGFFLMVWPALARRHGGQPAELVRAGLHHLRLFNTHPYFGGLVAGTVIAEEEAGAESEVADGLKRSLMCALGSIGDEFFWATLRPLAALVALPAALAGLGWAPLVLLAIYNLPHLAVRWSGVAAGLARGRGVLQWLQELPLPRYASVLGRALPALAGFCVGALAALRGWGLLPGAGLPAALAGAGAFALFAALLAAGLRPERLFGGLVLACAAAAAARVVLSP